MAALESFIFLCNDESKVNYAKGFEIRTKRLEQLREAIRREDQDYKNRGKVQQRESQNVTKAQTTVKQENMSNEAAEAEAVQRSPPTAPAAMIAKQQPQTNVIDPDVFGRPAPANAPPAQPKFPPRSPRPQNVAPQTGRGGQNLPFAPRGGPRGNFRGARGRGNFGSPGRGGFVPNNRPDGVPQTGQIDPNSFIRPRGSGYTGRGGRKLWVPT